MSKSTDDLITYISKSRRFTKEDVKIILEALIEFMEICAEKQEEMKVRGFGKLTYVPIPPRIISSYTDKNGVFHEEKNLPSAIKINFRLAENIRRYGSINSRKNLSSQKDFDEEETLDNLDEV